MAKRRTPADDRRRTIERVQTGVRMEKRILLVLKALAGAHDLTFGDMLEGIVLHAFDGHFDVILLFGLLEHCLCQFVAFSVEWIPLAVGVDAVAAFDALLHQRALSGVLRGGFLCDVRGVFGVFGEAQLVYCCCCCCC